MPPLDLDFILARFAQTSPVWWGIWCGLLLMTISLLALMRTRWGQSQPLKKCLALSVLAHLLMAGYATTVQIVHNTIGPARSTSVRISSVRHQDASQQSSHTRGTPTKRVDTFSDSPVQSIEAPEVARAKSDTNTEVSSPEATAMPFVAAPSAAADELTTETVEPAQELAETESKLRDSSPEAATPLEDAPAAQRADRTAATVGPTETLERPATDSATAVPSESQATLQALLGPLAPTSQTTVDPDATPAPATIAAEQSADGIARDASPVAAAEAGNLPETADHASSQPAPVAAGRMAEPQAPGLLGAAGAVAGSLASELPAPVAAAAPLVLMPVRQQQGIEDVPEIYRGRMEQESGEHDAASGATGETEKAVKDALAWLVANQSRDGRWDAERFGAGTERRELGPKGVPQDRGRAGVKADTGVTGLALLAFLGAGNTHLAGDHREPVRRGLDFLLASQRPDGNLGGDATVYAFMYCHGMATFALSEAYAMTGDKRLEQPLRRAISYTLASQNASTGGWRYRPGEQGDMSQLGWQLMSLKSASLAGIEVPKVALERAEKFIRSVSFGTYGGKASYRRGEQESRTMTAEALASRQFLGMTGETPTAREAADFILEELPGKGQPNLYFWYYASLALHNMQGSSWDTWNGALRQELLATQEKSGPMAGSWPTDSLWSGYGGRVYTAAMGALCLEVYYRYLPIYLEASAKGDKVR